MDYSEIDLDAFKGELYSIASTLEVWQDVEDAIRELKYGKKTKEQIRNEFTKKYKK